MCGTCAAHYPYPALSHTRVKLEVPRIITAALWLTRTYGDFTRSELVRHLGAVSNSPQLRGLLDALAMRGLLTVAIRPHPQSGRPAYFYSRLPVLQTTRPEVRPRAFSTPGASR
jgi:hypothetical protein